MDARIVRRNCVEAALSYALQRGGTPMQVHHPVSALPNHIGQRLRRQAKPAGRYQRPCSRRNQAVSTASAGLPRTDSDLSRSAAAGLYP
jgi:hypothetical protein